MRMIIIITVALSMIGVVGAQIPYDDFNPVDLLQYSTKTSHAPLQLSGVSPDSAKAIASVNMPLSEWHPRFDMTLGYMVSEWRYFNQDKDDMFGISPFGRSFLAQKDRIPASVIEK